MWSSRSCRFCINRRVVVVFLEAAAIPSRNVCSNRTRSRKSLRPAVVLGEIICSISSKIQITFCRRRCLVVDEKESESSSSPWWEYQFKILCCSPRDFSGDRKKGGSVEDGNECEDDDFVCLLFLIEAFATSDASGLLLGCCVVIIRRNSDRSFLYRKTRAGGATPKQPLPLLPLLLCCHHWLRGHIFDNKDSQLRFFFEVLQITIQRLSKSVSLIRRHTRISAFVFFTEPCDWSNAVVVGCVISFFFNRLYAISSHSSE